MTTRTIILNGREAEVLAEGRITQLRRPLDILGTEDHYGKPLNEWGLSSEPYCWDGVDRFETWNWRGSRPPKAGDWMQQLQIDVDDHATYPLKCPFGSPGTTLLCKEAYAIETQAERGQAPLYSDGRPLVWRGDPESRNWEQAHYRATDPMPALCCEHAGCDDGGACSHPWRAAQTMQREFVRITRVVVSVRAERCNAITEADARACGVMRQSFPDIHGRRWHWGDNTKDRVATARVAFSTLWTTDYGKRYPWETSWAWVCEVKRKC